MADMTQPDFNDLIKSLASLKVPGPMQTIYETADHIRKGIDLLNEGVLKQEDFLSGVKLDAETIQLCVVTQCKENFEDMEQTYGTSIMREVSKQWAVDKISEQHGAEMAKTMVNEVNALADEQLKKAQESKNG